MLNVSNPGALRQIVLSVVGRYQPIFPGKFDVDRESDTFEISVVIVSGIRKIYAGVANSAERNKFLKFDIHTISIFS